MRPGTATWIVAASVRRVTRTHDAITRKAHRQLKKQVFEFELLQGEKEMDVEANQKGQDRPKKWYIKNRNVLIVIGIPVVFLMLAGPYVALVSKMNDQESEIVNERIQTQLSDLVDKYRLIEHDLNSIRRSMHQSHDSLKNRIAKLEPEKTEKETKTIDGLFDPLPYSIGTIYGKAADKALTPYQRLLIDGF